MSSVSCAAICLHLEEPGPNSHAVSLFKTATIGGKQEMLIWGEDSGYKLKKMLNSDTMAQAALNGHLMVVKYLRWLDILWNEQTCRFAEMQPKMVILSC